MLLKNIFQFYNGINIINKTENYTSKDILEDIQNELKTNINTSQLDKGLDLIIKYDKITYTIISPEHNLYIYFKIGYLICKHKDRYYIPNKYIPK